MRYIELEILKKNGIAKGEVVEIEEVDTLLESMGFDGLGLDFEIEEEAMTFYKEDRVIEMTYSIIKRDGYFGQVKIESIDLMHI